MNSTLTEKISLWQLFVLIIIFEIGSSIVVGIGTDAKQDAWIAVLIATIIGMAVIRLYTYTLSLVPEKNLFEVMEVAFGRKVAIILSFVYVEYFLYIASRVLRDFTELLITDTYPNTPIEIFSVMIMLALVYLIYMGLEVFARVSEIFIPYIFIFLFLISIFLLIGGDIHPKNLQPVLAEGYKPIVKAIFPELIGFPFGETVVFMVVMAYTSRFTYIHQVGITAILTTGGILVYHTFLRIAVLGVDVSTRASFPFLDVVRNISIANFIERLDALVVFIMMLGVLVKIGLFFYGGLKGLEYVFRIPYRYFITSIGMLVSLFSMLIASNFAEHIEEGLKFVPLFLHMPLQIGIPVIIAITLTLRKRGKGGNHSRVLS